MYLCFNEYLKNKCIENKSKTLNKYTNRIVFYEIKIPFNKFSIKTIITNYYIDVAIVYTFLTIMNINLK